MKVNMLNLFVPFATFMPPFSSSSESSSSSSVSLVPSPSSSSLSTPEPAWKSDILSLTSSDSLQHAGVGSKIPNSNIQIAYLVLKKRRWSQSRVLPGCAWIARFGLYLNLQVGPWNDSRVAFTVLSQPPSVCSLPDDFQDVSSLTGSGQISLRMTQNTQGRPVITRTCTDRSPSCSTLNSLRTV